jgi:hypothetical protein
VGPAQQPQHLPLGLAGHLLGQQPLHLRGVPLGVGQALLQLGLQDVRGQGGCQCPWGTCSWSAAALGWVLPSPELLTTSSIFKSLMQAGASGSRL